MGKKAKGIRAERKKKEKQAAKARRKAQYAAFAAAGKSKGSKRFTMRNKRGKVSLTKHTHPNGACGNPGCLKCFPRAMTEPEIRKMQPSKAKHRLRRAILRSSKTGQRVIPLDQLMDVMSRL